MLVPERVEVASLHRFPLEYIEDVGAVQEGDGEWCCNGVEIFKEGCKSGQTDLGLQIGIKCWRSTDEQSDFDLCEQCIQWALHNERIQGDMGIGDLDELRASGVMPLGDWSQHLATQNTLIRSSTDVQQRLWDDPKFKIRIPYRP